MRRETKRKVRASPEWAALRLSVAESQDNLDPVTMKPLLRGFNLHHKSQNSSSYADLKPERFVALNHKTHELVHGLYEMHKELRDWTFLEALKELVLEMDMWTHYDDYVEAAND